MHEMKKETDSRYSESQKREQMLLLLLSRKRRSRNKALLRPFFNGSSRFSSLSLSFEIFRFLSPKGGGGREGGGRGRLDK